VPNARIDAASQYRVWTRAQAARSPAFWATLAAFFLCLSAQTAVLIYQLAFLQEPDKLATRGAAALAVTTTTIGSIVARMAVSMVADRLDKRYMALVLFVLQAAAIVGYLAVHGRVAIYATALVFGFTVGNVYMAQSLLVGELFGLISFGTVYGMVSLSGQVGSAIGLIGLGRLIDRTGYTVPFLLLAAADVVAAAIVLLARHPSAERT
jgi:predicted MFS family arabinose efflux permease